MTWNSKALNHAFALPRERRVFYLKRALQHVSVCCLQEAHRGKPEVELLLNDILSEFDIYAEDSNLRRGGAGFFDSKNMVGERYSPVRNRGS